jgi:hypothetical protein
MGVTTGKSAFQPNIVTNGLVLNLDAINPNSYPQSGTIWYDTSGNNNSGTLTNGTSWTPNGAQTSFSFDGVDDYVLGGNITGYFTNQVYASVFYKLTSAGNYPMVLTLGNADVSGEGFSFRHSETNGNIQLVLSTSSTTSLVLAGSVINQIVQVGLLYDGTNWKGYKNGVEFASASKTGNIQFGNSPLLRLGVRSDGFYFSGNIYNAQIYNRALTAQEVLQNYNALKSRFGLT